MSYTALAYQGNQSSLKQRSLILVGVVSLSLLVGFSVTSASNKPADVIGGVFRAETRGSESNVLPSGLPKAQNFIDMTKKYDVCTVGAGLSGAIFAERSANVLGKSVLVMDNRPHIGGNCYDFVDAETGILRNQYGAHLFHTSIDRVWEYLNSFDNAPEWVRWDHEVQGMVDGKLVSIPVNINTVNKLLGTNIQTQEEMEEWLALVQIPCPDGGCQNAEQMALSRVGEGLYEKIFRQYTLKQWAREPSELDALVTARIPVRSSFDPRYFSDKYQALPSKGYTAWFAAVLDNPKIDVAVNVDFFDHKEHMVSACGTIIYTGPIDRYFERAGYEKLEYRSIRFTEERYFNVNGYRQPVSVVNYPGPEVPYTRAIEYKHFLYQDSPHTIVVKETSSSEGDPYYPVPNDRNQDLFERYRKLAIDVEMTGKVIFAGRLANYKYFNMDAAIDNALDLWENTLGKAAKSGTKTSFHE